MSVKKGQEKHSIEKAILSEIESITRKSNIDSLNNFRISKYIKRSQYIEHLSQWMEIFPRNQFLIVKSEDLFATTDTTVNEVFEFLGLESYQLPKYPKVNQGKYPPISQSMRQTMNDYFRPFNQQLEEYLDRKFNWY